MGTTTAGSVETVKINVILTAEKHMLKNTKPRIRGEEIDKEPEAGTTFPSVPRAAAA